MAKHTHTTPTSETSRRLVGRRALALGGAALASAGPAAAGGQDRPSELVQILDEIIGLKKAGGRLEHPDAELLAIGEEAGPLIEEYHRLTAAWRALPQGISGAECQRVADLADPSFDPLEQLLERALELTATTVEGCAVKARLLQHEMRVFNTVDGELVLMEDEDQLACSLAEDLLALGRA